MKRYLLVLLAIAPIFGLAAIVQAASFTESFTGRPTTPIPWDSENWEAIALPTTLDGLNQWPESGPADHGPNCEPPTDAGTVTHPVRTYAESIYQCADHVMTHVTAGAPHEYGAASMTPNQLIDFTDGPATLRFDVSTLSNGYRDWMDVWIQDWDVQEQRILDPNPEFPIPTAQGNPRNAVHVEMGGASCCSPFVADASSGGAGRMHVEVYNATRQRVHGFAPSGPSWTSVLTPSAQVRSTIEVVISRTHVKVWMPAYNLVWVDRAMSPLTWSKGVVSFGHHNYGSGKEGQQENTWHWDEVSINPSVPFRMLHADRFAADYNASATGRTFTFSAPAPAGAMLRFNAVGGNVRVSFDGAPAVAAVASGLRTDDLWPVSYWMPIPQGTTRATFSIGSPTFGNQGRVMGPIVFVLEGGAPSPTTSPSPGPSATSTPSPTPLPTASPSPTSTSTPTPTPSASPTPTASSTPSATSTPTSTPSPTPSPEPCYEAYWQGGVVRQGPVRTCP